MDVIGVGFGRTGTLSLKAALEQVGLGPCLHMVPLLDDAERSTLLCAAADGDQGSLEKAFDGFRSTVDCRARISGGSSPPVTRTPRSF